MKQIHAWKKKFRVTSNVFADEQDVSIEDISSPNDKLVKSSPSQSKEYHLKEPDFVLVILKKNRVAYSNSSERISK